MEISWRYRHPFANASLIGINLCGLVDVVTSFNKRWIGLYPVCLKICQKNVLFLAFDLQEARQAGSSTLWSLFLQRVPFPLRKINYITIWPSGPGVRCADLCKESTRSATLRMRSGRSYFVRTVSLGQGTDCRLSRRIRNARGNIVDLGIT